MRKRSSFRGFFPLLENQEDMVSSAIERGDTDEVRSMLEGGLDPNTSIRRINLLQYAVVKQQPEIVRLILDHGAKINQIDRDKWTALHWAARTNSTDEIVRILIDAGAEVEAETEFNETPLHLTVASPHGVQIAKTLLDAGANIEHENGLGGTPFLACAYEKDIDLARFLFSRGANINAKDHDGRDAIRLTRADGSMKDRQMAVRALIEMGVNPFVHFQNFENLERFFDGDIDWLPRKLKRMHGMGGMFKKYESMRHVKLFEELTASDVPETKSPTIVYVVVYRYGIGSWGGPNGISEFNIYGNEGEANQRVYDIAEEDCRGDFSWLEDSAELLARHLNLVSDEEEESEDEDQDYFLNGYFELLDLEDQASLIIDEFGVESKEANLEIIKIDLNDKNLNPVIFDAMSNITNGKQSEKDVFRVNLSDEMMRRLRRKAGMAGMFDRE
jgi:hypothetical protein